MTNTTENKVKLTTAVDYCAALEIVALALMRNTIRSTKRRRRFMAEVIDAGIADKREVVLSVVFDLIRDERWVSTYDDPPST